MPQYEFKHAESGETITKFLRISEYDSWKEQNPEWEPNNGRMVRGVHDDPQRDGSTCKPF